MIKRPGKPLPSYFFPACFISRFVSGLLLFTLLSLLLGSSAAYSADASPPASAVASAHPLATDAGHEILSTGGNAFDAAIAVSAALAVVEPTGSGLGGGGFWLLHRASDGFQTMIDGRERAPLAASRDMYLDEQGNPQRNLSINGPLAAGIPGTPAALAHMAKKYGRLPLSQSLAPAIRLAREGFPVDSRFALLAGFRLKALQDSPSASQIFLDNKAIPELGTILKQPDLARTLEAIAEKGAKGFYRGKLAKQLVKGVQEAGGIWTKKDLREYKIVERQPIQGTYKGIRITSAAPPSSGGIALLTMLNTLSNFDLDSADPAQRIHLITEAMRRAYRDRAIYLGDPDFVDVPAEKLTHPYYAQGLAASIRHDRATPSSSLPGIPASPEGRHTSHFSILDKDGNRVSATMSINLPFGSAFVAPGTGVLLNDEMDDFSAKPGSANAYGLIGAEANAIAPGKRPLSSMTPTFLETDDRIAILGTPGGSRIITMVLLAALDFADGNPPTSWVSLGRFHHQFSPDVISFEPKVFSAETQAMLTALGHSFKERSRRYGNMHAILWDKDKSRVLAASDPRGLGAARVVKSQGIGAAHAIK